MPLHVICSGCLKRFQVGERFAGKQGPCPNCGTIIDIPEETVKIHTTDNAKGEGENKQKALLRPIPRFDLVFDRVLVKRYSMAVLGVLLLTLVLGCIPMYAVLRSVLGTLGLCLIAFPLTLFGYHMARDRGQIFAFAGKELYYRAGAVAVGYVLLWFGFEFFIATIQAEGFISMLFFATFAVLATLLVHPLLEMEMSDAFLHYCIFGISVIFLRFLIGFGWFWESNELFRYSIIPPPPFLPGM